MNKIMKALNTAYMDRNNPMKKQNVTAIPESSG